MARIYLAAIFLMGFVIQLGSATPAAAYIDHPWCTGGGARHCPARQAARERALTSRIRTMPRQRAHVRRQSGVDINPASPTGSIGCEPATLATDRIEV